MIRSASTLQYQIAADLVERHAVGFRVGYVSEDEFKPVFERHDQQAGLKVFKAHVCTEEFQRLFKERRAKGIYSYRDIRDVAVSAVRKFEMSFEDLMGNKWLDQAIADYELWTTQPGVLVSRYETIVRDLPAEVTRIAASMDIRLADGEAAEVAGLYTLESQNDRIAAVAQSYRAGGSPYDKNSLLHYNHISPVSQSWENVLTPEQVGQLHERYGRWLQAAGYTVPV